MPTPSRDAPGVCALVLAAGAASRFGSPKQLAVLGGTPLVTHAILAARHAAVTRIVVLVGCHADRVRAVVAEQGVDVVEVADWAAGLSATLRRGLAELEPAQAALVLLADQPGVSAAVVDRVLARRDTHADAVRASFAGRPGHPVLLLPAIVPRLRSISGDRGASDVLADATVELVPCDDIGSDADVDRPEDLLSYG